MWIFGHVGFTIVAAVSTENLVRQLRTMPIDNPSASQAADAGSASHVASGGKAAANSTCHSTGVGFDYRLIVVGALLPDVDKLVNALLFGSFDRGFLHSLLACLLVLLAGMYMRRRCRDTRGLQLGLIWGLHLTLDQMWRSPRLLLWPFMGWNAVEDKTTAAELLSYMTSSLTGSLYDLVPELLGAIILVAFGVQIMRSGVAAFLREGRVSWPWS